MNRKWTVIGTAIFAMTAVAAGGGSGTILVDNFNDGDSDGWEELDFTGGRGSFDASTGAYVLSTTEPIPVDDPSAGTVDADWERSEHQPRFANGTMRGTIRADTGGTTVGFLLRDSHETESDYGFFGSASFGTFYIEYFDLTANPTAPQTILAMADPGEHPFEVGVTYNLEARVVGHSLTLKAWKVGEREPMRPLLRMRDRSLGPDSASGIAAVAFFDPAPLMAASVTEVEVSGTVDDLTFTPGWGR